MHSPTANVSLKRRVILNMHSSIGGWDLPARSPSGTPVGTPTKRPHLRVETSPSSPTTPVLGDRFIVARRNLRSEMAHNSLVSTPLKENEVPDEMYTNVLTENLYGSAPQSPLPISSAPRTPMSPSEQRRREMIEVFQQHPMKAGKQRGSAEPTERTLDAPNLIDDYYLNLVDWSSKNVLAVALHDSVYLWREDHVQRLCCLDGENFVTSLAWSFDGSCLAVGTHGAEVQLWDVQRMSLVRNFSGHTLRVGSLAWNGHMLSSGSRDTYIINHDVRLGAHRVGALNAHTQEVCGLRWSRTGRRLRRAATTTCSTSGTCDRQPRRGLRSPTTLRPSRHWRGRHFRAHCWRAAAAQRTAQFASGTHRPGRVSTRSTHSRKCARCSGDATASSFLHTASRRTKSVSGSTHR